MIRLIPLLLILGLASCSFYSKNKVNVAYFGNHHVATDTATLYFSENDIPFDYTVIGKAIVTANNFSLVNDKLINRAKAEGANAVLVSSFGDEYRGEEHSTRHHTNVDSTGTGITQTTNSSRPIFRRRAVVLFLRWKQAP